MKKILVVDDEAEIRGLLKKSLEKNGYRVTTAASGTEALAASKGSRPDLILLDIAMPEMDGYQTCEQLRENKDTQDLPVLFLTGKDLQPEGIIKRYHNLGACGYIPKPSPIGELLTKIKELIG